MGRILSLCVLSCAAAITFVSCGNSLLPDSGAAALDGATVAGHALSSDAVLRQIPVTYINAARKNLHVAYQHTSHGTHVSYGLFGLPGFKAGDATLFGITNNAATADPDKLDFHDYAIRSPVDLSNGVDSLNLLGDPAFVVGTRTYLDDPKNQDVNVVMWSWCSISGHKVKNYLDGMQTLINEYGPSGTKVGTGSGKTHAVPVTFVFMTGHAESGNNVGDGLPKNQAELITDFCQEKGYLCLDYYSIDTHDMADVYYEKADDDGTDPVSGKEYYADWQDSHTLGADWFQNREAPSGDVVFGQHNTQHITANRKAFAMWYVLARIAGWDGITK